LSHGTIERDVVADARRPRAKRLLVSKNDLLPPMALLGAIYGWVLLVVVVAVALVVVLVR
jgi:hypothetical protein